MRVLVTGATGFIGGHLVAGLLRQGYEVRACARDVARVSSRFPGVEIIPMDFSQPPAVEQWSTHLEGVDVVVNTVGIITETKAQTFEQIHVEFPRRLFKACELANVQRVIQVSALGASSTATSAYHRSKHAADSFLLELELQGVIVKPSLVFGAGGDSMRFFCALAAQPIELLIDGGNQRVQPIHIDDLTTALIVLTGCETPPAQLAAVGPQPVSFWEMLASYRDWLFNHSAAAGPVCNVSVPYPLVQGLANVLAWLRSPYLNAENLHMLQQGNAADAAEITALLATADARPASMREALAKTPATDADRWHARLYFLLPLMRWAIAFTWLYTGVISAFVYPQADSYALLEQVGLGGWMLPLSLYGAAMLDVALGLAVLFRFRPSLTGVSQILVILSYTLLISVFLPSFWLHPFGPILKNIPLLVAIMINMMVERK